MSGISAPTSPIKFDSNGNVLANINAQNITPSATASNIKLDSNGNVLANLNAQNINPNINNPYTPELLSHQTGLSVTASSANTGYNIGSAISIPKNGIVKITIAGHINGGQGYLQLNLTRGSTTYNFGSISSSGSLFGNNSTDYITGTSYFANYLIGSNPFQTNPSYGSNPFILEIPVLSGDSLQFLAGNNTAGGTTYIDDMVVILQ